MNETRSVNALLQREFDLHLAKRLISAGETLASLTQKSDQQLRELQVPEPLIEKLKTEKRPPIPAETLDKLLLESSWACNICHRSDVSIILHHIVEWAASKNHDESNLIVLCLNHHGEAHTRRELGQNLTPERLRAAKSSWLAEVRERRTQTILQPSDPIFGFKMWDYFNHRRLVQLAHEAQLNIKALPYHHPLHKNGLIEEDGTPREPPSAERHAHHYIYDMYGGGISGRSGAVLRFYKAMLETLLQRVHWVDLTENWSRHRLKD